MNDLKNKKVAILVDNYFEEAELQKPLKDLQESGASVDIIAINDTELQAMDHANPSQTYQANYLIDQVNEDDYDALILPGGAINADNLRMSQKARNWLEKFMSQGKTVAAICHAPWLLISAGMVKGRKLTSYFTIQDDIRNAGAEWVDKEVVIDKNLITSRNPDDLPMFTNAIKQSLSVA